MILIKREGFPLAIGRHRLANGRKLTDANAADDGPTKSKRDQRHKAFRHDRAHAAGCELSNRFVVIGWRRACQDSDRLKYELDCL
ncbi:MAG: hypothetical protein AMXMBFR56_06240 [Polyangiaceae bacterium]